MTDEDRTAEKLKGNNCIVKFKDGEELLIHVDEVDESYDASRIWFTDVEGYLNGEEGYTFFPIPGFAVSRGSIKYVKKL